MVDLFPEDATLLLAKISILRDLTRKEERLALAKSQVERREGDPLFGQHYAQILMTDPQAAGSSASDEASGSPPALRAWRLLHIGECTLGDEAVPRSRRSLSLRGIARGPR